MLQVWERDPEPVSIWYPIITFLLMVAAVMAPAILNVHFGVEFG